MKIYQLTKPGLIGIAMVALVAGTAQAESQLGAGTPQNPQSEGTRVASSASAQARARSQGHWQMAGGDLMWVGPYKNSQGKTGKSNAAALAALSRQRAKGHWLMAGGDLMWIPGTAQTAQKRN